MLPRPLATCWCALIVTATWAVGGCAGGGEADRDAVGLSEYCRRSQAYIDATAVDEATVQTLIEGFAAAAEAARAVADVAPPEVRTAHGRIASLAEDLVKGITDRDPRTIEEFDAADEEIGQRLEETYPNLDEDVEHAQTFALRECDLSIE